MPLPVCHSSNRWVQLLCREDRWNLSVSVRCVASGLHGRHLTRAADWSTLGLVGCLSRFSCFLEKLTLNKCTALFCGYHYMLKEKFCRWHCLMLTTYDSLTFWQLNKTTIIIKSLFKKLQITFFLLSLVAVILYFAWQNIF